MASETMTIGPKDSSWTYDLGSKTYDLSRNSAHKVRIPTTRGEEVDSFTVDPELSALVIVDMQNWFLHPDCRDHPLGLKTVDPTIKVIQKCRELGIQIVWLNWCLTETDLLTMPAVTRRHTSRSSYQSSKSTSQSSTGPPLPGYGDALQPLSRGRVLMSNTWNGAIYDPLQAHVSPSDIQVGKNRLSGMWSSEQPLYKYLVASGKKTLFFTGVNTDRCVLGTLADAAYRGWDCVMLEDCTATVGVVEQGVACGLVEALHGFVTDSKTFCEAERNSRASP